MTFKPFLPAILFFMLTLVLLCLPGSTLPKNEWLAAIHADKIVHVCMFGLLCVLFNLPLRNSRMNDRGRKRWFGRILLLGIVYGVLMEYVQKYWVPSRSFEIMDILADSAGCIGAYWLSRWKFSGRQ